MELWMVAEMVVPKMLTMMLAVKRGCVRTQNHGWWGANGSGILLLL